MRAIVAHAVPHSPDAGWFASDAASSRARDSPTRVVGQQSFRLPFIFGLCFPVGRHRIGLRAGQPRAKDDNGTRSTLTVVRPF
jgi:hypothetical protein